MFPTLIVYRGYQNQPHRVDLARCPLCHERAAHLGDECHETLKTTGSSNISMYTQGIYMVYTTMYLFVYTSHILYIYIVYIKYIPCIYFVYTWYILYICL